MSIAQSLLGPPPLELRKTVPGRKRDASARTGLRAPAAGGPPSLHLLLDSPVQSAVPVLRAICSTKDPIVLIALARDPEVYIPPGASDHPAHETIHAPLWGNPYHDASDLPGPRTIDALLDQIQAGLARVRLAKPGARTTVLFDSLQPILDCPGQGISGAVRLVQGVLALMQAPPTNSVSDAPAPACEGRIVLALAPDSDFSPRTTRFVATLQSPSLWTSSAAGCTTSTMGVQGSTSISYLLPVQFAKVIQEDYAQRLPLTPSPASVQGGGISDDTAEAPDSRVWPLLSALTARGMLGRRDQPGWWATLPVQERPSIESVRPLPPKSSSAPFSAPEPSTDPHRVAALLVSFSRSGQGKAAEEVVGISLSAEASGGEELAIVPLTPEVVEELQPSTLGSNVSLPVPSGSGVPLTAPSRGSEQEQPPGDAHAALLAGLPFNLNETAAQRAQRSQVVLPHQAAQQVAQQALGSVHSPNQGRGSIVFHPEAVDDADEEELDEEDEEI